MVRVSKSELHKTIYDIMATSDLTKLTTKRIRLLCEAKYRVELTSRKAEIDEIVMEFVNSHSDNGEAAPPKNPAEAQAKPAETSKKKSESSSEEESEDDSSESESCSGSECSESSSSDEEEESKPSTVVKQETPTKAPVKKEKPIKTLPPKKSYLKKEANQAMKRPPSPVAEEAKPAKKVAPEKMVMDDAAYARQLQAEEWNLRQRNNRRSFRDTPGKKENKNNEKKKKATAFTRKCLLSPALAEVLGTDEMSRPDIVQKMWAVVRERNLFDSSNKQYALCDEQLTRLFGRKRVRLIGMMKYLKKHIKDIKDVHQS